MSDELPSFDRAEYVNQPEAQVQRAPEYQYSDTTSRETSDPFLKGLLAGTGAAIAGCLAYAAFTLITHFEIGIIALFLGTFIANAMRFADGGRGGRKYQIAAVILTYFSISMAAVVEYLWHLHAGGTDLSHIGAGGAGFLLMVGLASPFLALSNLFNGLIGLFILFIAMRSAWRTAGVNRQNG